MSVKKSILLAAAVVSVTILALILLLPGSGNNRPKAQLTVVTGIEGNHITSKLSCENGAASGSNVYSSRKQAQLGCAAVQKLKQKLQAKPAVCPQRSRGGGTTFSVEGTLDGKKVDLASYMQDCSRSLEQISDLSQLIRSTQITQVQTSANIVLMPPDPPPLTKADEQRAEGLIKKLGWRKYQQQYLPNNRESKENDPKLSDNVKACQLPLPKYFARACFIRVALEPGQTPDQAAKVMHKKHPEWFSELDEAAAERSRQQAVSPAPAMPNQPR